MYDDYFPFIRNKLRVPRVLLVVLGPSGTTTVVLVLRVGVLVRVGSTTVLVQ